MPRREESEGTSAPIPSESGLPTGSFSALLEDLARVPEEQLGEWSGPLRPGAVVGRFEILRELGRGGFGVVYEARDRELGRLVAFKAVRPGKKAQSRLREEWLRREAEAAAQLSHPNIVSLHDLGHAESGPYLVLELLQGESLDRCIERGPIPVEEAVRIAVEVARALLHAHASGVVHRDLKPANVFLTQDGGVKVLDFGLAHVFGTSGLEGSSGTPGYMAPEQWRGEPEDERTDVFAMGVVLYEMLTGERPYAATRERSEALDPGPPPSLAMPGAPSELVSLAGSMLSKDPAGRPRNGQAVLEGLLAAQRALSGETALGAGARRSSSRVGWVTAGAVALAAAVSSAWWIQSRRERTGERITVVVADFLNETRDPDLDGLSGLLITSLEQSRRLEVLTRSRMLDLLKALGKEKVERIDEGLAREVGAKAGARALIFASVRRFDELYAIEAKGFDPGGNVYLFTAREDAKGKSDVPAALDRLSERTRQALRESAAEIHASEVRIAEAATPSLEAHRHYFRGLDCVDRSPAMDPGCVAMFERAVAADPGLRSRLARARLRALVGIPPRRARRHAAGARPPRPLPAPRAAADPRAGGADGRARGRGCRALQAGVGGLARRPAASHEGGRLLPHRERLRGRDSVPPAVGGARSRRRVSGALLPRLCARRSRQARRAARARERAGAPAAAVHSPPGARPDAG